LVRKATAGVCLRLGLWDKSQFHDHRATRRRIEAKPTIKETVTQPDELFTVAYRVKNLTDKEVFARIAHRVELRLSPSIWTSSNAPCFYR